MNTNLAQFDQLKSDIQLYVKPITGIKVLNQESHDAAMKVAKELKSRLKKIDELRKELKAPYMKAAKEIDDYAKSLEALLTEPGDHLNQQFLTYNKELERKRVEEAERIRKLEAERQAEADRKAKEAMDLAAFEKEIGNDEAAEAMEQSIVSEYEKKELEAIQQVKTELRNVENMKVKGVTLRWDFKIVDSTKIPNHFMIPNETLIRKTIVDSKGVIKIPGVESFQKESMTIR